MKSKKSKLLMLLIAPSLLVGLAACSMNPDQPTDPDINQNDDNNDEQTDSTVPDNEFPVALGVTLLKDKYLFGSQIDYKNDIKVEVNFKDKSKSIAPYDPSQHDGWYVIRYSDAESISGEGAPTYLNKLGRWKLKIGYAKGVNKIDGGWSNFEVYGGKDSEFKPDSVTVEIKGDTSLQVGQKFSTNYLNVEATWKDYGGTQIILPGDGQNGYLCQGVDFDLNQPFSKPGNYKLKISYRDFVKQLEITVKEGIGKSPVNYDYQYYAENSGYSFSFMDAVGSPKALIVPIWFKDSPTHIGSDYEKKQVREDIGKAYLGTTQDTGWHSVKSYYWEDSYHQLDIQGVLSDWYTAPYNSYDLNAKRGYTTDQLVRDVSAWYKKSHTDEWPSFDTDNDGYIDAVVMIYAAPNNYKGNEDLWAYCSWTFDDPGKSKYEAVPNVYFWASYDFMYTDIGHHHANGKSYDIKIDAHTFIHEMGHILGLEDYYDYNNAHNPAGGFSMQDNNVGGHDPFSKLAYGWVEPYVPTTSTSITMGSFVETGDVILLTPEFHNSPFDEYLLLEYFTPTSLNEMDTHVTYAGNYPDGTLESGLRVWHVNARLSPLKYNAMKQDYDFMAGYYTSNPNINGVDGVMYDASNTRWLGRGGYNNVYACHRKEHRNFDLLALLNQSYYNRQAHYNFKPDFSVDNLWQTGDVFNTQMYACQFANGTKLDSNLDLGFSFEVVTQSSSSITVNIVKE